MHSTSLTSEDWCIEGVPLPIHSLLRIYDRETAHPLGLHSCLSLAFLSVGPTFFDRPSIVYSSSISRWLLWRWPYLQSWSWGGFGNGPNLGYVAPSSNKKSMVHPFRQHELFRSSGVGIGARDCRISFFICFPIHSNYLEQRLL